MMAFDPVASRYAQAVFESAKSENQLDATLDELILIGSLIRGNPELQQLMRNPDVEPEDKVGVLERVLKGTWSGLVRAFIQMVVSLDRAEYLPQIVEAFQTAVDKDQGRLRVLVRSAHPLSETVLGRLRMRLERREQKQIELETELAPELLGGLQIRLDHRVIDGSVRRQVDDLRQQLKTVRVY